MKQISTEITVLVVLFYSTTNKKMEKAKLTQTFVQKKLVAKRDLTWI